MNHYTDLNYLKDLTENDKDLINESLVRFLTTSLVQLDKLLEGTDGKDMKAIHDSAHSLYSTTQIVGIKSIAQELKDVQNLTREEGTHERIKNKVDKIEQIIRASQTEIKEELDKLNQ